jgi:hypothetical protein
MPNFNYLAMGILVGCLAPYALTLIKPKTANQDQENSENDEDD